MGWGGMDWWWEVGQECGIGGWESGVGGVKIWDEQGGVVEGGGVFRLTVEYQVLYEFSVLHFWHFF